MRRTKKEYEGVIVTVRDEVWKGVPTRDGKVPKEIRKGDGGGSFSTEEKRSIVKRDS